MRRPRSTALGWALLGAYIIAWDLGAARSGETLSSGFRTASRHRIARWPVALAWALTTAHLFGWLPPRVDPYRVFGRVWLWWRYHA